MSNITLEQALAARDALFAAQAEVAMSGLSSVSIGGRTVTYRSLGEIIEAINYWSRIVAGLQREAGGESRLGVSVANFQSTQ